MAGGTFPPTITIRWSRRGFDRLCLCCSAWPVAGRRRHRGVRGRSRAHGRDPCLRRLAQGQSSRPAAHGFLPGAGVHPTAASIAGALPQDLLWAAAMAVCYLTGLTYAAKQEDLKQPGRLWPLAFLGASFVYGVPIARGSIVGLILYAAFLVAVIWAVSLMVRRDRSNIPRVVSVLIAGICLLDALFIAGANHSVLALVAALGFPLTLFFQRSIPGT